MQNNEEIFFYVYDANFEIVGVIDRFISLTWSDRYDEAGDFELVVNYSEANKNLLQQGRFCNTDFTNRYAIIERIEISKDDDGKTEMTVSGRSLEILLDRRIVMKKTEFGYEDDENGEPIIEYFQDALLKLFNENLIEPEEIIRQIPGFIFQKSEESTV